MQFQLFGSIKKLERHADSISITLTGYPNRYYNVHPNIRKTAEQLCLNDEVYLCIDNNEDVYDIYRKLKGE